MKVCLHMASLNIIENLIHTSQKILNLVYALQVSKYIISYRFYERAISWANIGLYICASPLPINPFYCCFATRAHVSGCGV